MTAKRRTKPLIGKPHIFTIGLELWRVRVKVMPEGYKTVVAKSRKHAFEIAKREYSEYYRSHYQPWRNK